MCAQLLLQASRNPKCNGTPAWNVTLQPFGEAKATMDENRMRRGDDQIKRAEDRIRRADPKIRRADDEIRNSIGHQSQS